MNITVGLPPEDVDFLDSLVARKEFPSRADGIHKALELLRKEIAENGFIFLK